MKTRVLFVCLGNICRSPMAEFILKDRIKKNGLSDRILTASRATSAEELGNPVYPPARELLNRYGIGCSGHHAQVLSRQDYAEYDLLIGMERRNLEAMKRICGGDPDGKMHLLSEYASFGGDIADPWYTGDFETAYAQITAGVDGLLMRIAYGIRRYTMQDLPRVQEIYAYARAYMKRSGNPNQWRDTSPEERLLLGDIEKGTGYVLEENGQIYGVFALIPGQDPTYGYVEGGAWLNDEPYETIHRIASDGTHQGVVEKACAFAASRTGNIRIDTHEDNKTMQHVLDKLGFTRCGIIYLLNGEPRIAYQKVIKK